MVSYIILFYLLSYFSLLLVLGKKELVPFYQDEMEDESEASSADEGIVEPRWCTVRRDTHINGYGDAASYIGMEFSRSDVQEGGAEEGGGEESLLSSGTIHSVVRKRDRIGGSQHFKLVNLSGSCNFVPCKMLMSTAKSNVFKVYIRIIYILLLR